MNVEARKAGALIRLITALVFLFNALIPYASSVQALSENDISKVEFEQTVTSIQDRTNEKYVALKFARPEPRLASRLLSDENLKSDHLSTSSARIMPAQIVGIQWFSDRVGRHGTG